MEDAVLDYGQMRKDLPPAIQTAVRSVPDQDLVGHLHDTYWPQVELGDFDKAIGGHYLKLNPASVALNIGKGVGKAAAVTGGFEALVALSPVAAGVAGAAGLAGLVGAGGRAIADRMNRPATVSGAAAAPQEPLSKRIGEAVGRQFYPDPSLPLMAAYGIARMAPSANGRIAIPRTADEVAGEAANIEQELGLKQAPTAPAAPMPPAEPPAPLVDQKGIEVAHAEAAALKAQQDFDTRAMDISKRYNITLDRAKRLLSKDAGTIQPPPTSGRGAPGIVLTAQGVPNEKRLAQLAIPERNAAVAAGLRTLTPEGNMPVAPTVPVDLAGEQAGKDAAAQARAQIEADAAQANRMSRSSPDQYGAENAARAYARDQIRRGGPTASFLGTGQVGSALKGAAGNVGELFKKGVEVLKPRAGYASELAAKEELTNAIRSWEGAKKAYLMDATYKAKTMLDLAGSDLHDIVSVPNDPRYGHYAGQNMSTDEILQRYLNHAEPTHALGDLLPPVLRDRVAPALWALREKAGLDFNQMTGKQVPISPRSWRQVWASDPQGNEITKRLVTGKFAKYGSQFEKKIPTYEAGEAAGYTKFPMSTLESFRYDLNNMIGQPTAEEAIRALRTVKAPSGEPLVWIEGEPFMGQKIPRNRPPEGYVPLDLGGSHGATFAGTSGGNPIMRQKNAYVLADFHPDVQAFARHIYEGDDTNGFQRLWYGMKRMKLMYSLFHPTMFALREAQMGRANPRAILSDMTRDPDEIMNDPIARKKLLAGVRGGLNLMEQGTGPDAAGAQGRYANWLFGKFGRNAQISTYLDVLDRLEQKIPNVSPEARARFAAGISNDAFGSQSLDALLLSPKVQKALRFWQLAPMWSISEGRMATGAMPPGLRARIGGIVTHPNLPGVLRGPGSVYQKAMLSGFDSDVARALRWSPGHYQMAMSNPYFRAWANSLAIYAVMNGVNYGATAADTGKGRFMWQNPQDRKSGIFVGHDPNGRERYIMPSKFITDSWEAALNPGTRFMQGLHPVLQGLDEMRTGRNYFGDPIRDKNAPAGIQAGQVGLEALRQAGPIGLGPIETGIKSSSVGDVASAFSPFPVRKGLSAFDYVDRMVAARRAGDAKAVSALQDEAVRNGLNLLKLEPKVREEMGKARFKFNRPVWQQIENPMAQ